MELVVVVVLIGMMTALAVPRFRQLIFENSLKSSSRKLIGLLDRVSGKAAGDQEGLWLRFDLSADRIWLADRETGDFSLSLPPEVDLVEVTSDDPDDPEREKRVTEGETAIWFSARGYVTRTLIRLQNDEGDALTIYLSPFLGVTRVFDGAVDFRDEQLL